MIFGTPSVTSAIVKPLAVVAAKLPAVTGVTATPATTTSSVPPPPPAAPLITLPPPAAIPSFFDTYAKELKIGGGVALAGVVGYVLWKRSKGYHGRVF